MRWDIVFWYNVWNQHGICYQPLAPKWSKCRELSHSKLIWLWVKSLGTSKNGWLILERTSFCGLLGLQKKTHTYLHTTRSWNLSKVVTYDFYVGFTKISGSDIETWFVTWVCLVESLDFNVDYVDCTKKKYGCFSWLGWETWAVWLHDVDDWINKNQVDRTSRFNSLSIVLKQKKRLKRRSGLKPAQLAKFHQLTWDSIRDIRGRKATFFGLSGLEFLPMPHVDKHGQAQVGCGIYWDFRSLMGNV